MGSPNRPADSPDRASAALHGFIEKTRITPEDDLVLARKRQKELKR